MRPLSERGLTLTELTIVTVLASIAMLGLVGFYLNSQATWMDASAQAITQREATTLTEAIADDIRRAGVAKVVNSPDELHSQLELYPDRISTTPLYVYWWDATDSLVHEGETRSADKGAQGSSTVERFQCIAGDSAMVQVSVQMRSAQGQRIQIGTSVAMMNYDPNP
jgi:Tfp pilus assembly protein PilW